MSTDIVEEPLSTSYEFYDAKNAIIVTLYANGAYEIKDIDISIETDSLEVRTPAHETWIFQLWEHIYTDQVEIRTQINSAQTQTSIEISLIKQQPRKTWPQLYSNRSKPIVPQRDEPMSECVDMNMIDEQRNDLSLKKLKQDFFETNETFTSVIYIKQVYNFQVNFTETNFTATFHTNDEHFRRTHAILSDRHIRLFVRVKERIKPEKCSYRLTPTSIELKLCKDNPNSRWGRLEPNEYSESRPVIQQVSPITPPSSPTSNSSPTINSTVVNSNKAIPLPPPLPPSSLDRQTEKYPTSSAFTSSIQQKDTTLTSAVSSFSSTIGFTGIYNPANSCFMNAAIQCLSNTRELRDYFLQSYHLSELNRTNPLGMKGAIAEEFGELIKNLWNGKYNWTNAQKLRNYAAKRHQEFVGNGQHDAQELLTILLDAVHEDLNRVITKPQVPPIEDQGRPDHVVADEYWRGYLRRNDSIIVQLFTGQFKSKTKCPQCHKESVTFDPFTTLSVPLPKRTAVDTIVTYRNEQKPSIKYRIVMSADGLISELKRNLSNKCGLPTNKMTAYRIRNNRVVDHLKDNDRLTSTGYSWNNNDIIYITETLTSAECNNEPIVHLTFIHRIFKLHEYVLPCGYCQASPNPHSSPKFCNNCYQISYCDETCHRLHAQEHKNYCGFRSSENYEIIGLPFVISLPESNLTCKNVFEQISIYAKRSVDIHIERSNSVARSLRSNDDYDRVNSDLDDDDRNEDEDTFSDIENVDWPTIKNTLSSSDSWSICRLGDYFVKNTKNKRRRQHEQQNRKEKMIKNNNDNDITRSNSDSNSSTEEFDMLDDIYRNKPLFRLMPQTSNTTMQPAESIVEPGDDADRILRRYTTFSIDWFTDNKPEAPLRVIPSKHRNGINGLIDDDSVFNASSGDQEITLQQCLQMFIEPEVLGPDDKWYCPYCKEHMQAEKIMSVWRLPPILIIHLKRFKYYHGASYGYFSDSRVKIDTNVKYPVHDLDMAPYCSSKENSLQARYDLYSIVNHRGSAWFGHYTSYARLLSYNDSAKTEIGWRNFDDERVSSLSYDKELVRPDAYVLFYRHRNLPLNLTINAQTASPMPMDMYEDTVTMESSAMKDVRDFLQ
ncbi:unnamed protein product [Rotaria magnacalcarata]|uniref:ubiquitinyl hydrolase 1 n=3 Tax=Rotaria magnacalcarata TaxID=392030 RepID=A0A816M5E4_9BILA|nr:unnamed protein product [Rotaria magnacalcarata]CAF1968881.1 unnamed protein product [Rotaria magnacalcarata]